MFIWHARVRLTSVALAALLFAAGAVFYHSERGLPDAVLRRSEAEPGPVEDGLLARREGGDPAGERTGPGPVRDAVDGAERVVFCAQVDEVDRCIDPVGTELLLIDEQSGLSYRARIGRGGGAAFEGVIVGARARTFRIVTAVPDRRCFPETVDLRRSDFRGEPPTGGVSVALVHLHELRGRVLDAATSLPIQGARVAIDSFTVSETASKEDGTYALNLNEPQGTVIVAARGYQELLWRYPIVDEDGRSWLPHRQDFRLLRDPLTAWIEIRATHPDGTPASFAEIRITEAEGFGVPPRALEALASGDRAEFLESLEREVQALGRVHGESGLLPDQLDEDGRAVLRVLEPGAFRIEVSEGDRHAWRTLSPEPGTDIQVALVLAPAIELEVVAYLGDEPVADAEVAVTGDLGLVEHGRTNQEGVARFAGLPPGERVTVVLAAEAGQGRDPVTLFADPVVTTLPEKPGGRARVEFACRRRSFVEGLVEDRVTRLPIEGAQVETRRGVRITGRDGRFRLAAERGDIVLVKAPGYRNVRRVADASSGLSIGLWPLRWSANTRIEVQVLDGGGAPRAGAKVEADVDVRDSEGRILGSDSVAAVAGADGIASVSVLLEAGDAAVVRATATMDGLSGGCLATVAEPGVRRVSIRLREPVELHGRVILEDGSPVAAARVEWRPSWSAGGAGSERAETDSDGRFALPGVAPVPGMVIARAPYRLGWAAVTPDEAGRALVLRMTGSRRLRVAVVDAVSGAPVRSARLSGPWVGEDGRTIEVPVVTEWSVIVRAPGYEEELVRGADGEVRGGTLVVRIRPDA